MHKAYNTSNLQITRHGILKIFLKIIYTVFYRNDQRYIMLMFEYTDFMYLYTSYI